MSATQFCNAPVAPVYLAPTSNSQLESQLLYGQGFIIRKITDRFAEGDVVPFIANPSGPVSRGFVRVKDLSANEVDAADKVTSLKAPIFSRKDIKSPIKMILPFGARVQQLSSHREFIRIGRGQYIHRGHIGPIDTYVPDFVATAEHHLGLPYIWGGVSTDGLDCSGLVQSALWSAGRACPRNSGEQQVGLGAAIDIDAPKQRGDLIFWKGHVGIMQDSENMIHANGYHMKVQSEPLTKAAARIKKSAGPIIAIKRL